MVAAVEPAVIAIVGLVGLQPKKRLVAPTMLWMLVMIHHGRWRHNAPNVAVALAIDPDIIARSHIL